MWRAMDDTINRANAARYFILHAFGGLYLDLDVECWRPTDAWLRGADVVLQVRWQGPSARRQPAAGLRACSRGGPRLQQPAMRGVSARPLGLPARLELDYLHASTRSPACVQGTPRGVTNGVMAGVPGHPLWEAAIQRVHSGWRRVDQGRGAVNSTMQAALTGPGMLRQVVLDDVKLAPGAATNGSLEGRHRLADGTALVVQPVVRRPLGRWLPLLLLLQAGGSSRRSRAGLPRGNSPRPACPCRTFRPTTAGLLVHALPAQRRSLPPAVGAGARSGGGGAV
jgi:hypothetical protein